jgi:50S ribosomal protein L16 3-hydroxylase
MLHRSNYIFINGTSFEVGDDDLAILKELANVRSLSGTLITSASADVIDALHTWHKDGWLLLGS